MRERKNSIYRLTVGGLLLAIGIIIPRLFHMFGTPDMGIMFQPMHFSVFIAGIYLGALYGTIVGFLTPLVNSLFGMPMFPFNVIMAFELAAYGFFAGLFMYLLKKSRFNEGGRTLRVYISLIVSMIAGRIIYAFMLFIMGRMFAMNVPAPVSVWSAVLIGLPGIILQLILVPGLVFILYKSQNRQGR